jgi:D-alanyl-D-alanine carboxypeptidase
MGYKLVVIDLGNVWTRGELDSAIRRSLRAANFYAAMRQLQRRAHKERLAVVFHHFDGSSGFPAEDHVVYRVLMEVGHHCPSPLVAFTARDAYFVGRCLRRYNSFKSYVRLISFTSDLLGIAQEADE